MTTIPTNWLTDRRVAHPSLLKESEVPRRFADVSITSVKPAALLKVAEKYNQQFWDAAPKGIAPLLLGTAGQFKTVTAAVLARGIREQYLIDVAWCNCATAFVQFDREAFAPETKKRIDWLKTVPFLVMDDFSHVQPNSRMMATLVEVGCTRFDDMLPTLWTGNLTLAKGDHSKLVECVGTALARRMLDASAGFRAQIVV